MDTVAPLWLWVTFCVIVLVSLFIDFVVLKKQGAQDIGFKEALRWSMVWIVMSFLFNGLFWWAVKDSTGSVELANAKSLEFLTGYLIEKSLAVDNIFVFLMIFTYFAVPSAFQKRVLMIGIVGAIVLRSAMILAGSWLPIACNSLLTKANSLNLAALFSNNNVTLLWMARCALRLIKA